MRRQSNGVIREIKRACWCLMFVVMALAAGAVERLNVHMVPSVTDPRDVVLLRKRNLPE